MKRPLIKTSDNLRIVDALCPGRYQDNGVVMHGVYLRTYSKTEEKLIISNGHLVSKYRYPRIEKRFFSAMVNDRNLHLCGGWHIDGVRESESISRVIEGLKPMGFLVLSDQAEFIRWKDICADSGMPYIHQSGLTEGLKENLLRHRLGIATSDVFGKVFDLDALMADYTEYARACQLAGTELSKVINGIRDIEGRVISESLSFEYPHGTASMEQFVVRGLILGYPIETTVSRMWM